MKNSTKAANNSKQYKIPLNKHSTANPTDTVTALRIEWDLLNGLRCGDETASENLIAANICDLANFNGLNPCNMYGMELKEYINEVWLDMNKRFETESGISRLKKSISKKCSDGADQITLLYPLRQSVAAVVQRARRKSDAYKAKEAAKKATKNTPYDATMWPRSAVTYIPIEEMADHADLEDQVTTSITVRQVMATFDEVWVKIAELKAEGLTDEAIGDLVGLKRGMVNRHIQQMRAAFRDAGLR